MWKDPGVPLNGWPRSIGLNGSPGVVDIPPHLTLPAGLGGHRTSKTILWEDFLNYLVTFSSSFSLS